MPDTTNNNKMTPSNPMFSKEWLDAGVAASVPAGLHMRPLEMGDFDKGYVDLLAQLTQVGDLDKAKFEGRLFHRSHSR